jgi:UDP-glucuronate 4-epimerase
LCIEIYRYFKWGDVELGYRSLDTDKTYLVTGAAGFIGFYLSRKLLEKDCRVIGIDNMNDYYDVDLKYARLGGLELFDKFTFARGDISDKFLVMKVFKEYKPHIVVNLAAHAGVRYSMENPDIYIRNNIMGFFNILEGCRHNPVDHLVYASSSSVYGSGKKVPFEESDFVDSPLSLYAASKRSNELMAYAYSHLYGIPSTGLRFFTVYGPMGRPDMVYFRFADEYFAGEPVRIFNNGGFEYDLYRDFTYIDDTVEGILRLLNNPPGSEEYSRIFNIGSGRPEKLMVFVDNLERALSSALGKKVVFRKIFEPMKPEDVPVTYASTDMLQKAVGFKPSTTIEEGLQKFADWYVKYNKIV